MMAITSCWRVLAASMLCTTICDLAGCATPPIAPPGPPPVTATDTAFNETVKRYFAEMLPLTPVQATALGDHSYDAKLDDVSAAGYSHRAQLARELLAQLAPLDPSQMSRAHQVDTRLLKNALESQIWSIEQLEEWRWNPLLYTDLAGNSVYMLLARDFAPLPQRLRNAQARLAALPQLLSQVRDSLVPARVPRIHAETAVKQNSGILVLIDQFIVPQIGVLPPQDQARLKEVIARARTAVSQHQIWLEKKLLPAAKGDFRLGAELYDTKLRFTLSSPLSRQEIRTRARAELARTRQQMYAIAKTVLLGRANAPALPDSPDAEQQQAAIVAALELAYAERPERDKVFEFARNAFEETRQFVRQKDLITLYDDPIDIIPMPEFQRGVAVAFCDPPGPLDRGQKTFYAVSPMPAEWSDAQVNSFLREYNTRSIYDLTIHEAMPGHYVQLTHANRYDSPLRAVLASGSFIEGWAVYSESMMVEQGFSNGDPLMHLIQLKWYLRTVANAILDQSVHVEGMSRDDAMWLMTHDTFQQEREAAGKWVRAQLTAAQLPTYFVGYQEHAALREDVRKAWGKSFTLKHYHDTVLSYGSAPVRYVRELMLNLPIE